MPSSLSSNGLVGPDVGCRLCWRDERAGLLVWDGTAGGGWVHPHCLDFFGVDSVVQWERCYLDDIETDAD